MIIKSKDGNSDYQGKSEDFGIGPVTYSNFTHVEGKEERLV